MTYPLDSLNLFTLFVAAGAYIHTISGFALGMVIILGASHLMISCSSRELLSGRLAFFISGLMGGVFGCLFGIAGPPMVYHYYRQPLDQSAIHNSLIILFAFISIGRSFFVTIQDQLNADILQLNRCFHTHGSVGDPAWALLPSATE